MKNSTTLAWGLFGTALLITAIGMHYANKDRCVRYKVGKFKKFTLLETSINC